jgi:hypothetical protein
MVLLEEQEQRVHFNLQEELVHLLGLVVLVQAGLLF